MRRDLLHVLALLALDRPLSEQAGAWGVAALAAGEDTATIRVLAGFSAHTPREEVTPYLLRAAHELNVRVPTREESEWIEGLPLERAASDLAKAIAESRTALIEGSVRLAGMRHAIAPADDEMQRLFMPFVAVSSETDHLPLADERAHWNAAALRRKDEEIRAYERACLPELIPACEALAARLGRNAARTDAFL